MARKKKAERHAPTLYVRGVSAEEWSRVHGVAIFSYPCSKCGRMLTTTEPFAHGDVRGLRAPPCECGNARTPYGMVVAKGKRGEADALGTLSGAGFSVDPAPPRPKE